MGRALRPCCVYVDQDRALARVGIIDAHTDAPEGATRCRPFFTWRQMQAFAALYHLLTEGIGEDGRRFWALYDRPADTWTFHTNECEGEYVAVEEDPELAIKAVGEYRRTAEGTIIHVFRFSEECGIAAEARARSA